MSHDPRGWVGRGRDAMQASPDELPAIDIHSLCPLPDARSRQSH